MFFLLIAVQDLPEIFGWRDLKQIDSPLERVYTHSLALPDFFRDNETSREFSLLLTLNSKLVKNFNISVSALSGGGINASSLSLFNLILKDARVIVKQGNFALQELKPDFVYEGWQKFVVIYRGLELLIHDCTTVTRISFPVDYDKDNLPSWENLRVVVTPNFPTREDVRVSISYD